MNDTPSSREISVSAVRTCPAVSISQCAQPDGNDVPSYLPGLQTIVSTLTPPTPLSVFPTANEDLPSLSTLRLPSGLNSRSPSQISLSIEAPCTSPTEEGAADGQRRTEEQKISSVTSKHADSNTAATVPSDGSLSTEHEVSALTYFHPDVNSISEVSYSN